MGNYKFKLSDMIPNAWFYKLKDMNGKLVRNHNGLIIKNTKEKQSSKITNQQVMQLQPHINMSEQRKSYHFTRTRDLLQQKNSPINTTSSDKNLASAPEPPRKSSRRRSIRSTKLRNRPLKPNNRIISSSVSSGCSFRATLDSVQIKSPNSISTPGQTSSSSLSEHDSMLPEYGSDDDSSSCKCKLVQNVDIVQDMVSLPPIITNKHHQQQQQQPINVVQTTTSNKVVNMSPVMMRRFPLNTSSSSPGVRLRTNTPRVVNRHRRIHDQGGGGRKNISVSSSSRGGHGVYESYAVVKSSKDPRRDFRESMVEMITENNIRGSKDFEDLLACYLSLNSNHYHHLIINVFKQIWFDFINQVRLN